MSLIACFDLGIGFCCWTSLSNYLLSISPTSNDPLDKNFIGVCVVFCPLDELRVRLYVHRMSSYHPCFGMLFYLCLMYYFFGASFLWFGVLIFFILFLPIPTYLGLRGNIFFLLRNFSMCMLAPVVRIRIANPYTFNR